MIKPVAVTYVTDQSRVSLIDILRVVSRITNIKKMEKRFNENIKTHNNLLRPVASEKIPILMELRRGGGSGVIDNFKITFSGPHYTSLRSTALEDN